MSRAFVKETETVEELPDRLVSEHPNYVTPTGLALIEQQLQEFQVKFARAQNGGDRGELASIARDLRYWESRRATAMLVPLPNDVAAVRFGNIVTIERDDGRTLTYQIAGEDEADPTKGSLSYASPLARALLGKAVGETVIAGDGQAEIVEIAKPESSPQRSED